MLQNPRHPNPQALVPTVPRADSQTGRERVQIDGEIEELMRGLQSCPFNFRYPHRFDLCNEDTATLREREWSTVHGLSSLRRERQRTDSRGAHRRTELMVFWEALGVVATGATVVIAGGTAVVAREYLNEDESDPDPV